VKPVIEKVIEKEQVEEQIEEQVEEQVEEQAAELLEKPQVMCEETKTLIWPQGQIVTSEAGENNLIENNLIENNLIENITENLLGNTLENLLGNILENILEDQGEEVDHPCQKLFPGVLGQNNIMNNVASEEIITKMLEMSLTEMSQSHSRYDLALGPNQVPIWRNTAPLGLTRKNRRTNPINPASLGTIWPQGQINSLMDCLTGGFSQNLKMSLEMHIIPLQLPPLFEQHMHLGFPLDLSMPAEQNTRNTKRKTEKNPLITPQTMNAMKEINPIDQLENFLSLPIFLPLQLGPNNLDMPSGKEHTGPTLEISEEI
jgi:hypothetical protein